MIKLCSIPGVDFPVEEIDIEGVSSALKYLDENPGKFIFLDNPKGTKKRFGQKNYKVMPFHYGEFVEITEASLKGKWSAVVFYPADFTFVCPTELGDIADHYEQLQQIKRSKSD